MIAIFLLAIFHSPSEPVKHILPHKEYHHPRYITEFSGLALFSIKLYQWTLSGQQGDVCNFQPSCSHFAFQAIKEYGPILGTLMASDRIQRCHSFSWMYAYKVYPVVYVPGRGMKLYDPPKGYRKYLVVGKK